MSVQKERKRARNIIPFPPSNHISVMYLPFTITVPVKEAKKRKSKQKRGYIYKSLGTPTIRTS